MGHPLFARKSIAALQAEANAEHGMKRTLGAFDLTLLGIGAIMGTGIFVLTGHAAAANAGPAVTLSFVIAGLAATLAALCYSEMAAMIPISGSAYTYAYATMGELVAFMIGWDLILEYTVDAATVSVGWSSYVVAFVQHATGWRIPWEWSTSALGWNHATQSIERTGAFLNVPAVFIVGIMTLLLVRGMSESARFNAGAVLIKVTVVLVFIAAAGGYVRPDNWQPFIPPNTGTFGHFGISGVLQGATMVFFAYIGFDAVSATAQETRNPQRDVPIGILASLAICTVLYVIVAAVLTGVVPYSQLSVPHPIALGIAVTGVGWLETVIEIGAVAGLSAVILVMLMAQPRIFFTMAHDGMLPPIAARLHRRYRTPYVTTLATGGICALAGGILPIEILGELTSIGTLFAFVLVSAGVLILRLRSPEVHRPFRVPGGTFLVPGLSIFTSGLLMYTATGATLVRLFIWMALGLAYYMYYGRRHSRLRLAQRADADGDQVRAA